MEKQNNFLIHHIPLIIYGPVITVTILVVATLYELNFEYIGYFIAFILLSWGGAVSIQFLTYRKAQREVLKEIAGKAEDDLKCEIVKEKEDFFAMWAHQIKTPIAALNLLLQSEDVNVKECRQETIQIENYVEMALNYLRFDNMSNDLVLEPVCLESIVKEAVKKQAIVFIYKHLNIKLENMDYVVLSDGKWLSFVLDQLLSNALKYTKEGGITISGETGEDTFILKITDTGVGIRSEDMPKIFSKGFTGYNGRMDKKASGIGLYLCKGVCDKLGHRLEIESVQGAGTTISILLNMDKIKKDDLTKM